MEQNTKTLADYLDLIKRRKYYLVVTWLLVSVTSVIVAYNLPKIYRSTATILIETPIPTKFVESTVSQFAQEQIQSIYQRVMTTDNVLAIIEAHGLYKNTKEDLKNIKQESTKFEQAELFRNNTEVKLAKSSLAPQTNSEAAEIAFDISFSDKEAIKAQEIAAKLNHGVVDATIWLSNGLLKVGVPGALLVTRLG